MSLVMFVPGAPMYLTPAVTQLKYENSKESAKCL